MKRIFLIIVAGAALVLGGVFAQEAEEPAEPESAPEAKAPAGEEDSGEPVDDVFVPSERISADQEVIFPVDI